MCCLLSRVLSVLPSPTFSHELNLIAFSILHSSVSSSNVLLSHNCLLSFKFLSYYTSWNSDSPWSAERSQRLAQSSNYNTFSSKVYNIKQLSGTVLVVTVFCPLQIQLTLTVAMSHARVQNTDDLTFTFLYWRETNDIYKLFQYVCLRYEAPETPL